jgi:creatinine amidohydrolase
MTYRKIWWNDFSAFDFHGLDPMKTIAVFPTAAIEQHGPHLPVGTDTIINQGHLDLLVERAPRDMDIRILPVQAIGKSNEHIWQTGTLSHTATNLIDAWTQVGLEIARAGIRKVVFVNSHGGNVSILDIVARELRVKAGMLQAYPSVAARDEQAYKYMRPTGPTSYAWIASDIHPLGAAGEAHLGSADKGRITVETAVDSVIELLREVERYPLPGAGGDN